MPRRPNRDTRREPTIKGAFLNVRVNAVYLDNKELAGKALERSKAVLAEIRQHQAEVAAAVETLLA